MIKNICCIGAGYVGGPTMAVIAEKCPNINVTLVDTNPEKISAWNGGLDNLPVYEPGLKEIIKKVRGKNLFFSNEIEKTIDKSEMIFIAVNTPTKTSGEGSGMAADLKYIIACSKQIAKSATSDKIIIEKSTLPVRTAEKVKEILYSEGKKDVKFEILSNPEFLAEGTAISDLYKSDRVLIGGDNTSEGKRAVKDLIDIYANWIPREKILTTNVWSSELAKLASNAMLAQRISSINSLSAICEKTGADIDELSKAIGMDRRIGPYFLKASVGFGGSCFKKDILNLVYLSKYYGLNEVADYWHSVVKINEYQKNRFSRKIIKELNSSGDNSISLLGWSFKKDTNDSRESASIDIAHSLYNAGVHIIIYDPMVSNERIFDDLHIRGVNINSKNVQVVNSLPNALKLSNNLAILTEWNEFKDYKWGDNFKIFDGRNILSLAQCYYSIGRSYEY
jgi:UDPglucose 6-dehydrogenase